MENINKNLLSNVDKLKDFYYKDLFRKIYTVVIVGLIAVNIFSLFSYYVMADGEWNTATLTTNIIDGSKTITYDGKSYTLAGSDLPGAYYWGFNENTSHSVWNDSTATSGEQHDNVWGGGNDRNSNGYSPNPDNYIDRKGPCDAGWHVPSAGEWLEVAIQWCHLPSNDCDQSFINSVGYLNGGGLSLFKSEFSLGLKYWTSSPYYDGGDYYHYQAHYMLINDNFAGPIYPDERYMANLVRCMKNPERTVSLDATTNGGSTITDSVQITEGETLNLSQYKASKDGYSFVGWNTNKNAIEGLSGDYVVTGDITLYAIFKEWNTATLTPNADGSKTITYDGKSYTLASGDLAGTYQWGTTSSSQSYSTDRNAWGGSGDNEGNGYSPNPDNYIERQGPCDAGWHVPSGGEWNAIVTAWCHLDTNECTSSDISAGYINNYTLASAFEISFVMTNGYYYWSSTPYTDNMSAMALSISSVINPNSGGNRYDGYHVRCVKNPVRTVSFNANGGSTVTGSVQIAEGETLNLSQYTASKDGYTFVGWNTSSTATTKIGDSYVVDGDVTLYAIFKEWNTATLTTNADGSKTITYDGKSYTLASGDLAGTYQWGTTSPAQSYNDNYNAWGGGQDTEENGFNSGNSRVQRQGPCDAGWHVPSEGEWEDIITTWCHLSSNECTNDDIVRNVYSIALNGDLLDEFNNELGLSLTPDNNQSDYRTSSPYPNSYGFSLSYVGNEILLQDHHWGDALSVRCIKNPTKTVSFNANGGTTATSSVQITEGETLNLSQYTASKDGYTFVGWNTSSTATTKIGDSYVVDGDVALYAIFSKNSSGGGSGGGGSSSSGGGGRKSSSTSTEEQINTVSTGSTVQNNTDKSDANNTSSSKEDSADETQKGQKVPELDMGRYDSKFSFEMNQAYQFAYAYGITNKSAVSKANMGGKLTRIQMAKMLSNYAINVLGMEPDMSKGTIKFNDVTNKLDRQYDNGVTLAYQLGIMGQNIRSNRFRPYDEVTRGEFAAALSRMLYGTKDGTGKTKYYEPHLAKLYNEGIIFKRDPNMKEKRGYVMLMLERSAE